MTKNCTALSNRVVWCKVQNCQMRSVAVDQPALARSWQLELVRSPRNGIHYSSGHQKLSSTNSKSQIGFSKPFVKVENIFTNVNLTFDSGLHWDLVAKGPDHLLQEEPQFGTWLMQLLIYWRALPTFCQLLLLLLTILPQAPNLPSTQVLCYPQSESSLEMVGIMM